MAGCARALLLVLVLAAPLAPLAPAAVAQVPPPANEALPGELLDLGHGWVQQLRARTAALAATGPVNATSPEAFAISADDFVNRSQPTLAMTQVYQGHVAVAFLEFNRTAPQEREARRAALLQRIENASREATASWDAFLGRLRTLEGSARTTHALEYGVMATLAAIEAEADAATLADAAERVRNATAVGDDLVLVTFFGTEAAPAYFGFASDLLGLAERAAQDGARPQLQQGAKEALLAQVQRRFLLDPDSASVPGPLATRAAGQLQAANRTGPTLLVVARFLAFEEARTRDALGFLLERGGIDGATLRSLVEGALASPNLVPRYDATFQDAPSPLPRMRNAGYLGALTGDARNHAAYRAAEDPSDAGIVRGWTELVVANFAAEALAEARAGRGQGLDTNLVILGGVAVAVALVAIAVGVLRK
ncbi:MAG TPA: hypothetical protein VGR28_04680 [Candidatus Thermoplasmatota archaeon]|jgi:hypothetical protein|nr:hypothetical protein [Candidatus Thermoplasmatota archaeon]